MNSGLESAVRNFLERRRLLQVSDSSDLKNLPFVTVGICVKNSERTIGECLKSIVNCNYDKLRLEIIVVDGKSVDNTLSIARDILQKSRIAFKIFSDEGKGLGYARQMVVDNARGEHICWVDADSIVLPDFIGNGVKFLENETSVGVMIPLTLFFGQSTVARLQGYTWLLPTLNALVKGKTPYLAMNGAITPKRVIREVGGFNVSIKGAGEDIDLIARTLRNGYRVVVNPRALIYHRMRESWRDLFKEVSWWGRSQPRKRVKILLKEILSNLLLCSKLTFSIIKHFQDSVGVLMPFYAFVWNSRYLISALCPN